MELFEIFEFLLVISIPVVGGFFLYNDIRWNKFSKNSVLYGCIYAFIVCVMLAVNARYGFMFAVCNKIQYGLDSRTYAKCVDDVDSNALIGAIKGTAAKTSKYNIKSIFIEHYRGHKVLVCVYNGKLPNILKIQQKYIIKNEMIWASRKK